MILVKGSYRTAINGANSGLVKSDIRSRGYVLIRSPDPREQPAINPRYLAADTDRRAPAVSSTNTNAPRPRRDKVAAWYRGEARRQRKTALSGPEKKDRADLNVLPVPLLRNGLPGFSEGRCRNHTLGASYPGALWRRRWLVRVPSHSPPVHGETEISNLVCSSGKSASNSFSSPRGTDGSNPSPSSGEPFCEPNSTGAHHGGPRDAMGRAARNGNFVAACNRWSASDAPAERLEQVPRRPGPE